MPPRPPIVGSTPSDDLSPARDAAFALVRLGAVTLFALSLFLAITVSRPDLIRPTTFGSDTWNYEAAAERFVAHHSLYRLTAGDRPVPLDNPPRYRSPFLYPPAMAAVWTPFLVLPDGFRHLAWWAFTVGVTIAVVAFVVVAAPIEGVVVSLPVLLLIAVTVWSGNVNGLLLGIAALAWFTQRSSSRPAVRAVGAAAIGVAIAVKLTPVALLAWLIHDRRWRSSVVVVAVALATTVFAVNAVGVPAIASYVGVAAATEPTAFSLVGLAEWIGVPRAFAAFAPYGALLAGSLLAIRVRSPRWSFAVAWATAVVATPVLRSESLGLLVGCLVPWAGEATRLRWRAVAAAAAGLVVAFDAVVASVWSGALVRSSLVVINDTPADAIVRFSAPAQAASVAYGVRPNASGVAWSNLRTMPTFRLYVFDRQCRLLGAVTLPDQGGTIVVSETAVAAEAGRDPRASGRRLPYDSWCHPAMRSAVAAGR